MKDENNNKMYTPIVYYKSMMPYIKNKMPLIDNYSQFIPNNVQTNGTNFGILIEMMKKNFDLDPNNIMFSVFTIINLSNYQKVNNPPNPPYINVNNLKIYSKIREKYNDENIRNKIKQELEKLQLTLKTYDFYKNDTMLQIIDIDKTDKII
jgi:hypothetical protein